MMSRLKTFYDHLQQQPRALQWSVFALSGLLLFLLWDGVISPVTNGWKSQADLIQTRAERVHDGRVLAASFDRMGNVVRAYGPIELPGPESDGRNELNAAINGILERYSITEESSSVSSSKVRKGTLGSYAGNKRLESLKLVFDFISTPKDALSIIADLEADPSIEFITNLRITKAPGKKVKVHLTIESWVLGSNT